MSLEALKSGIQNAVATPAIVSLLVDNSGSMAHNIENVIEGFNFFIKEQASKTGSMLLSVTKFDDTYNPIFKGLEVSSINAGTEAKTTSVVNKNFKGKSDTSVSKVKNSGTCLPDLQASPNSNQASPYRIDTLSQAQSCFRSAYYSHGHTRILDALKANILDMEEQLKSGKRDPKEKVIIALITDGETGGDRTKVAEIRSLVEKKIKDGWNFFFLGTKEANAIKAAEKLGIKKSQAATYVDVKDGLKFLSNKVSEGRKDRTGKALEITQGERLALSRPGAINEL